MILNCDFAILLNIISLKENEMKKGNMDALKCNVDITQSQLIFGAVVTHFWKRSYFSCCFEANFFKIFENNKILEKFFHCLECG